MTTFWARWRHGWGWAILRKVHHADFVWFLPFIARLPLRLAYALSALRGHVNARLGRDWRSVALGYRHIRQQSLAGYRLLPLAISERELLRLRDTRFRIEAQDEFEAQLVAHRRVRELECSFEPAWAQRIGQNRERGLILLTPHFGSFYVGMTLLARSGGRFNAMSSAITSDPRVDDAVKQHFWQKYRGLEYYLNGGKVLDMELGLKPFYRMLKQRETLLILADSPVLPGGASMQIEFLGAQRIMAGGALRLAQKTGSDLGGYVCICVGPGRYHLDVCPIGPADDPATMATIYRFFSEKILASPGQWWAADLLPNLPAVTKVSSFTPGNVL